MSPIDRSAPKSRPKPDSAVACKAHERLERAIGARRRRGGGGPPPGEERPWACQKTWWLKLKAA